MKKLLLTTLILSSIIATFGQQKTTQGKTPAEKLNDEYCSGLFNTTEGVYFDMLNDNATISVKGYQNILDWMEGRVAGLQIYKSRNNERLAFIRNSPAGIYVDEIYRDPSFLNTLPVSEIAMIKIIKGPFASGFNSPGGIIAIYTIGTDENDDDDE